MPQLTEQRRVAWHGSRSHSTPTLLVASQLTTLPGRASVSSRDRSVRQRRAHPDHPSVVRRSSWSLVQLASRRRWTRAAATRCGSGRPGRPRRARTATCRRGIQRPARARRGRGRRRAFVRSTVAAPNADATRRHRPVLSGRRESRTSRTMSMSVWYCRASRAAGTSMMRTHRLSFSVGRAARTSTSRLSRASSTGEHPRVHLGG